MSRISNTDARAFAEVLIDGAAAAEARGEKDFDLTAAAGAQFDAALADAQAAIDAAKQKQT